MEPIAVAIRRGDPELLRQAIAEVGADFPAELRLAAAVCLNDLDGCRRLIPEFDLNKKDQLDRTPLEHAVALKNPAIVQLFLEQGADPNVTNVWGGNTLYLARAHDLETMRLLIAAGVDVNRQDMDGRTVLYKEIRGGDIELVRTLLDAGADLIFINQRWNREYNVLTNLVQRGHFDAKYTELMVFLVEAMGAELHRNGRGEKLLLEAIENDVLPAVRILLHAGVSADARADLFSGPVTAIVAAIHLGNEPILTELLDAGARVPAVDDAGISLRLIAQKSENPNIARMIEERTDPPRFDATPAGLAGAIIAGERDAVERIIQAGVDPDAQLLDDHSALSLAVRESRPELITSMIDLGAKPGFMIAYAYPAYPPTRTALEDAALKGDLACVRALLDGGADIEKGNGDPPIFAAVASGNSAVVRLLLERGANPAVRDSRLSLLARAAKYEEFEMMEILYSVLRDRPEFRAQMKSALRDVIYARLPEAVAWILERCAGIENERDPDYDEFPLLGAANRGHAAILKILLEAGAWRIRGEESEGQAVQALFQWMLRDTGPLETIQLLIDFGADVNQHILDREGASDGMSLHLCCERPHDESVEIAALLLERGADRNARDGRGRTPLMWAVESGDYDLIRALLEAGVDRSRRDQAGLAALDFLKAGPESAAVVRLFKSFE